MQNDFSSLVSPALPKRPGISPEFLEASGAYTITAKEAALRSGEHIPAVVIPYYTPSGNPVQGSSDSPLPFERLRYFNPTMAGRRYWQRAGSGPSGYVMKQLQELTMSTALVVVEGEFKCMSLIEAGIPAIGIGGISSAMQDGQLVRGLHEIVRDVMDLERVYFLGDSDTSLLFEFSREAVKLAKLFARQNIQVHLPRIGLDGPGKGIDDVKEKLGDSFLAYWTDLITEAEPVSPDVSPEQLALRLLLRENKPALRDAMGVTV